MKPAKTKPKQEDSGQETVTLLTLLLFTLALGLLYQITELYYSH